MKKTLFQALSGFFIYTFLTGTFIYFICNTKNVTESSSILNSKSYEYDSTDPSHNTNAFIADKSKNIEESIINFMQNVFDTRNAAILDGNVENLYKFYDTTENFGEYSLKHEFKRIAFLRNLTKTKNLVFKSIKSTPSIKDMKIKNGVYNLTLSEKYNFIYFNKSSSKKAKNFNVELIHTLELKDNGNSFIITKDYYEDYFKNGLDEYDFNLTEKTIP